MHSSFFLVSILLFACCTNPSATVSQETKPSRDTTRKVGGNCERCDLMYVGMPAEIDAVDTSAAWKEGGQKLKVQGRVYEVDAKTPAAGVIIYYYHTDSQGIYPRKGTRPQDQTMHGYLRGWVKSDNQGRYEIHTIRPGTYPSRDAPAHIHLLIKEPDINEYYIDDWVFDDDPLVTREYRDRLENRGGSGILTTTRTGEGLAARHDIILGLHIPDYPSKK